MNKRALNPTPAPGSVFGEHLAIIREGNRLEMALLAVGTVALTLFPYIYIWLQNSPERLEFDVEPNEMGAIAALLGVVTPLAVWRGDGLARRSYLFAMPADRVSNQLKRLAAGWIWLMILMLLFFLWSALVSTISGGEIGVYNERIFTGQDLTRATPTDFQIVSSQAPWWNWLTPITAATTFYLMASTLMIGTRHPWRWAAGIWLVGMVIGLSADEFRWESLMHLLYTVAGNQTWFGMLTGVTGMMDTVVSVSEQGHPVYAARPDAGAWLASTALWMTLAIAATAGAVSRHRES